MKQRRSNSRRPSELAATANRLLPSLALLRSAFVMIVALVIGAYTLLGSAALNAEEAPPKAGFAISPPLFEVSANPGDTIEHSIRLDSLTDTDLPLKIDRKDFVALGEEGQAELVDQPSKYSLSTWIKPSAESVKLPAKKSETVKFKIEVPSNAEPGGHFGSIVFRTEPQAAASGGGTVISQQIGALVLLKVAGEVKEKASILDFKPTQSLFEGGPVSFESRFKNEGNVQVKPTGTITITNLFGQKIDSVPINSRTVLPESTRKMQASWPGTGWPGWYTATLSLNYGSNNHILTSSTRFVVFPYKVIIPVVIALVVLGILIYRGRARLVRSIRILIGKE